MTGTSQLSTEKLTEFNIAKDSLKHVYLFFRSRRDAEPENNKLISLCHLVFRSLTVLGSVLDDEAITEAMVRGAFEQSQEVVEAVKTVFGVKEVGA